MARPLVLGRTDHPTIWTPVYADVTDPKMTDWLWEQRESNAQKKRFLDYKRSRKYLNMEEQDRQYVKKQKQQYEQNSNLQEYRLMTSVSMPVFDRRENAVRSSFTYYSKSDTGTGLQ
jgi:voltage-dependent calcium channel alpha-2/delta-3